MDWYRDPAPFDELGNNALIVAVGTANAEHVQLLAHHVDHPQRKLAQLSAHRTERAAEAQGIDAQPHEIAFTGQLDRGIHPLPVPIPPDAPVIRMRSLMASFRRSVMMRCAVAQGHMAAAP